MRLVLITQDTYKNSAGNMSGKDLDKLPQQLDDLSTRCKSILWLHGTRFRARRDGIFGPQFRRDHQRNNRQVYVFSVHP